MILWLCYWQLHRQNTLQTLQSSNIQQLNMLIWKKIYSQGPGLRIDDQMNVRYSVQPGPCLIWAVRLNWNCGGTEPWSGSPNQQTLVIPPPAQKRMGALETPKHLEAKGLRICERSAIYVEENHLVSIGRLQAARKAADRVEAGRLRGLRAKSRGGGWGGCVPPVRKLEGLVGFLSSFGEIRSIHPDTDNYFIHPTQTGMVGDLLMGFCWLFRDSRPRCGNCGFSGASRKIAGHFASEVIALLSLGWICWCFPREVWKSFGHLLKVFSFTVSQKLESTVWFSFSWSRVMTWLPESGVHLAISWPGCCNRVHGFGRGLRSMRPTGQSRTKCSSVASCSSAPVPGQVLFM